MMTPGGTLTRCDAGYNTQGLWAGTLQGHIASKWQSQDYNQSLWDSKAHGWQYVD